MNAPARALSALVAIGLCVVPAAATAQTDTAHATTNPDNIKAANRGFMQDSLW